VFVEVVHSNLSTRTNSDGRFSLGPILDLDGTLSLRLDSDADGRFDRQKLLSLREVTQGGLAAGQIELGENAFIRGTVLLSDVMGGSGHAGTTLFVPGNPFSSLTADTGAFLLRDLPTGNLSIAAFHNGYASA